VKKWASLRYWWRLLPRVMRLLASPRIPVWEKLLFVIPALAYWVFPDLMPFVPIDDAVVTLLLAEWFAGRMERKYQGE
jgi:uncharacterized membrane protein YkvA (DUF1232 family)